MARYIPISKATPRHSIKTPRYLFNQDAVYTGEAHEQLVKTPNVTAETPSATALLPNPVQDELEFLKLIDSGDLQSVYQYLKNRPHFDINCQNHLGHTGLTMAVQNEDEDMVEYLMNFKSIEVKDAVLHAVSTGNEYIVSMLLDKLSETEDVKTAFEPTDESSMYEVTPLVLAAQLDIFELVKLFLSKGHLIMRPHHPYCNCKLVCKKKKPEGLEVSRGRLNLYRALSGPSYIAQSSGDPILTCFMLSQELKDCAEAEREFQKEYLELSKKTSQFATDLLEQCHTSEEVECILEQRKGKGGKQTGEGTYPRVLLALETEQKKFVAHPNVQQVLRSAWLQDWHNWKRLNLMEKLVLVVPRILFLPVIAFLYLVLPGVKFTETWRTPINKFMSFAASYVTFLLLLFIETQLDSKRSVRGPPRTGLEWVIIMYIAGYVWQEMKQVWADGLKSYLRQGWNKYDIVMLLVFLLTFSCWFWSYIDVCLNDHEYLPRKLWHQYDPALIGEALFSVGTILAFGRMMNLFQIGNSLGPLQVSISYMFRDMGRFMVIFFIVLFSFATGLNKLYHSYHGMVRTDADGEVRSMSESFTTFRETVKTLFWAIFAMVDYDVTDIIIEEQRQTVGNDTVRVINKHRLTQGLGHILFGIYHIAAIVVLLNLLIAMMSTSFMNVENNEDMEWKFVRTQVWISYFGNDATLPPPYNLIPSPKSFYRLIRWIFKFIIASDEAKFSQSQCCYLNNDNAKPKQGMNYQVLMNLLVQRYLQQKSTTRFSAGVTITEFEALQQEVHEMQQNIKRIMRAVEVPPRGSVTSMRVLPPVPVRNLSPLLLKSPLYTPDRRPSPSPQEVMRRRDNRRQRQPRKGTNSPYQDLSGSERIIRSSSTLTSVFEEPAETGFLELPDPTGHHSDA